MGGKSKSQVVGYWYKVLYHAGLGVGPIDAFVEFRGGDKPAWRGELTSSGTISVNAPFLWGGEKDQGGIVSDVDVMFGEADQVPSPYLLANLGPQVPAWRGLATLVFKGGKYGAMNPYPQKASYKIRKILKGWDGDVCWYPEKAAIPMTVPPSVALYFAIDLSGSMDEIASNGQSRLANMKSALSAVLDQLAEAVAAGTSVDIMIVGFGTQPNSRESIMRRNSTAGDIATVKAWVNGRTASYWTYFTAGVVDMPSFFADATAGVRLAFFLTDGEPSVSDSSMTSLQIAQEAGAIVATAGAQCYGINIDLADTSFTAYVDTTPADGVPVVSGGDPAAIIGIIRTAIFGGVVGMNPAHVLYYARTNSDIGREPTANLNDASFRASADKLYGEGFGICTSYDPAEESLEEFEQRIGRLIGGSVSRSLVDGQYYLDLARNDYELADLPILTDDDILDFGEQPSTLDGATNSVSVKYFDVDRKEEITTPPIQALGLIDAFGTIHQVNEYPEVPTGSLAVRLADRDVRTTTTPTRAFDLVATRKPYGWRQNQYFRLQAPKRGIADMVCILGELSTGTLKSGAIKFKATQDIYTMSEASFVEVEPGVDTRPSQTPLPILLQKAFEAPYVEAVQSISRADLAALPPEVGYLLSVAADPAQSRDYAVAVAPDGTTYNPVTTGVWCPTAQVVEGDDLAGHAPLTMFTLAAGQLLDQVEVGSAALWDNEICRVDALDVGAGTITLGRACADTVPAVHSPGARIWFYDASAAADTTEYTEGESISVKLLTNTGSEQLPVAAATPMTVGFKARIASPYPPGQFKVNGEWYPASASGPTPLSVNGVPRNRDQQADLLIDTFAEGIEAEAGTTYILRGYEDGVLMHTETGIAALPATWTPTQSATVRIELSAERGGLESFQAHSHTLEWTASMPDNLMAANVLDKLRHWWPLGAYNDAAGFFQDIHGGMDLMVFANGTAGVANGGAAIRSGGGASTTFTGNGGGLVQGKPAWMIQRYDITHVVWLKPTNITSSSSRILTVDAPSFDTNEGMNISLQWAIPANAATPYGYRVLWEYAAMANYDYPNAPSAALPAATPSMASLTRAMATSSLSFSVNGAVLHAGTFDTAPTGGTNEGTRFAIGNEPSGSASNSVGLAAQAAMQDWAIFEPTLNNDELNWLYNGGAGRNYADLWTIAGRARAWSPVALSRKVLWVQSDNAQNQSDTPGFVNLLANLAGFMPGTPYSGLAANRFRNDLSMLNGRKVLTGNSTSNNGHFAFPNTRYGRFRGVTGLTVVEVTRPASPASSVSTAVDVSICCPGSSTQLMHLSKNRLNLNNYNGGGRRLSSDSYVDGAATPTVAGWAIVAGWNDYTNGTNNVRVNGGTPVSSTIYTTGVTATSDSSADIGLGGNSYNTATRASNNEYAEVLVFARLLTTTELEMVEGYLAHAWGLAANLPGGHPYKSAPPSI